MFVPDEGETWESVLAAAQKLPEVELEEATQALAARAVVTGNVSGAQTTSPIKRADVRKRRRIIVSSPLAQSRCRRQL